MDIHDACTLDIFTWLNVFVYTWTKPGVKPSSGHIRGVKKSSGHMCAVWVCVCVIGNTSTNPGGTKSGGHRSALHSMYVHLVCVVRRCLWLEFDVDLATSLGKFGP